MSNACDGGTKIEGVDGDVVSGDYPITFDGYPDTVRITVTQTSQGPTFAFKVLNYPNDHVMTSVLVKGGPQAIGANWYDYGSAGPWDAERRAADRRRRARRVSNDDGLHSPLNTQEPERQVVRAQPRLLLHRQGPVRAVELSRRSDAAGLEQPADAPSPAPCGGRRCRRATRTWRAVARGRQGWPASSTFGGVDRGGSTSLSRSRRRPSRSRCSSSPRGRRGRFASRRRSSTSATGRWRSWRCG